MELFLLSLQRVLSEFEFLSLPKVEEAASRIHMMHGSLTVAILPYTHHHLAVPPVQAVTAQP